MTHLTPPGFQHRKAYSNGLMHHFVMGGQGPALLLIHGWMGNWYHWRKVMPLLSVSHTVIAIDARGYGESDKPNEGYDGLTLVADVLGILGGLGIEKFTVVGHDMGALPALLLAAVHPEKVNGLVYVDEPLPGYNLDQFTKFSKENPFVYWWFAFNSQAHVPTLMWQGKEDVLVDYFLTAMSADPTSITEQDKAEYVRCLRKPGGLHGSFGWYRDVLKTADQILQATQQKIQLPVLALNGQFGHPQVLEQMQMVATNVSGETFPFCGHLVAEEQPVAMASAILNFTRQFA
jgi:pimeloyl-ACP methyl ester carboxylesterase